MAAILVKELTPPVSESEAEPVRKEQRKYDAASVELALGDATALALLFEFCNEMHDADNLSFLLKVKNFVSTCEGNPEQLVPMSADVFNSFICSTSENQICLSPLIVKKAKAALEAPTLGMFDKAYKESMNQIRRETFPRFETSKHYLKLQLELSNRKIAALQAS